MSEPDDDPGPAGRKPTPGPSTPPDLQFNPLSTAIAVFTAVAIPVFVFGYTRAAGPSAAIIALGVVAGLVLGLIAGLWVAHRDGRIYRGPQL